MHKLLLSIVIAAVITVSAAPTRQQFAQNTVARSNVFQNARTYNPNLTSRDIFTYAFNLCEAGTNLEQLDVLFDTAAKMQDRNPGSPHYGNFRWSWRDGYVMDTNAVEFCMENGVLIWIDHRDKLTPSQRDKYLELVKFSIIGCLKHHVPSTYTNIAIMNAQNLILLGETFERPEILAEGLKRLRAFTLNTALFGITEYCSPTYTGVDLCCLHVLNQYAKTPEVKATTDKLLKLFWSDLCANAFKPALRYGGTHSRDYDYLCGRGIVDSFYKGYGIFPLPEDTSYTERVSLLSNWQPSPQIKALADVAPRYVTQIWGESPSQNRVFWAGKHVALSISGANYHNMDIPLAVNFESENYNVRAYFIADGRRDPYGKKPIPEGSGAHNKTLHLKPFWSGVQARQEALGLVIYRLMDIPATAPTLESHFVFPADADEILIDDAPVLCEKGKPFTRLLSPGQALFIRCGAGAAGVRIPWARAVNGSNAQVAVVWDDNASKALRLTVAHHDYWGMLPRQDALPAAAFWLRVMDHADDADAFAHWRLDFHNAICTNDIAPRHIKLTASGKECPLIIETASPFNSTTYSEPKVPNSILMVNGKDIGKEILGQTPGIAEYWQKRKQAEAEMEKNEILVQPLKTVLWEAELGTAIPKMTVGNDDGASGGRFVWAPGEPGERGGGPGYIAYQLNVLEAGTYYLWGRISTATPDDDSFSVSITQGNDVILPNSDWHLLTTGGPWEWCSFITKAPTALELPKGRMTLKISVREDGAKLDQLFLSPDLNTTP